MLYDIVFHSKIRLYTIRTAFCHHWIFSNIDKHENHNRHIYKKYANIVLLRKEIGKSLVRFYSWSLILLLKCVQTGEICKKYLILSTWINVSILRIFEINKKVKTANNVVVVWFNATRKFLWKKLLILLHSRPWALQRVNW